MKGGDRRSSKKSAEVSSIKQDCLSLLIFMYNNQYMANMANSPYYNNYMQIPQVPQVQNTQNYRGFVGLQGKTIDNIDVVKATDIPLDGSISYFPLADNSAIVTKQLQSDGTSKIIVFKPVLDEKKIEQPKYITENDLKEQIKSLNVKDIKDIKEELKLLKRQIEDITDEIKDKKEK